MSTADDQAGIKLALILRLLATYARRFRRLGIRHPLTNRATPSRFPRVVAFTLKCRRATNLFGHLPPWKYSKLKTLTPLYHN